MVPFRESVVNPIEFVVRIIALIVLTIVMLVGNLLIRVAVAGIVASLMWFPFFLLLNSANSVFLIIFGIVLSLIFGLWECCDMTGLKEKIERL